MYSNSFKVYYILLKTHCFSMDRDYKRYLKSTLKTKANQKTTGFKTREHLSRLNTESKCSDWENEKCVFDGNDVQSWLSSFLISASSGKPSAVYTPRGKCLTC